MDINILYFAWCKEKSGRAAEVASVPEAVNTVKDLVGHLIAQGDPYTQVFSKKDFIRVAVNQEHVPMDASIKQNDEVAFFPPVTGG